MKSKLCCVLNPFVICDKCVEGWCEWCWSDRPYNSKGAWGPNKYPGHINIEPNASFMCGDTKVSSDYRNQRAIPIHLVIDET